MILYRLFDALWLNTDIPLCGACAAMLQQPLNQRNIKAIGIINLRSIPFAEAMGTDTLIAQIVANNPKLLLDCPFCDRENQVIAPDAATQTVILHVLLNHQRDSKDTSFDDFTSISKQLVDYQTELGQYLDYGESGLILGAANSPFRTAITNDALRFLDGEYTVAYISNKSLKIQNATIENSLVFGKLTIMPRDGGASIMWAESEGD